ncbi:uncharacterized protein BDZ83DRAFT_736541 [Colletotrichum acutatum]|uniref:Cyanovirin-N domain-containing protein n=1 Tax=Glomerella acutata TaxID=27357 RepID=A0AAD8U8Z6_GLOAC|nr:uncharacterized protein BDZ83DRAFT_736541 [Colletotrichum acutatum]KAK1702485.1 hypothetical protein BDZ83DRAFT_736541 [Colletotrichum acutatum]
MNERYKMVAFCRTTTGDWNWSVLDLNHCIVNRDGSLMAQDDGSFFLSAGPCSSDNATKSWANYKCSTQNDDSDERHVDHGIDLNLVVGNDNGTLFCGQQPHKGLTLSQGQAGWSGLGVVN